MATASVSQQAPVWRVPPAQWIVAACVGAALIAAFFPGLEFMVANWAQVEEYSYGYFIPVISAFLIWQRSDRLRQAELRGSWSGLALVLAGLALGMVGEASAITKPYCPKIRIALASPTTPSASPASTKASPVHEPRNSACRSRSLRCQIRNAEMAGMK